MTNYLMSQLSVDNIPLYYVVRVDLAPGTVLGTLSREQQLIYNAALTGPAFRRDNMRVSRLINSLTVGENATHWISDSIKRSQNERAAMLALRDHFDGTDGRYTG